MSFALAPMERARAAKGEQSAGGSAAVSIAGEGRLKFYPRVLTNG